jgi:hypothetical protein
MPGCSIYKQMRPGMMYYITYGIIIEGQASGSFESRYFLLWAWQLQIFCPIYLSADTKSA